MTFVQKAIRLFSSQGAKSRTPMIKFRKGGTTSAAAATATGTGTGPESAVSGATASKLKKSAPHQSVLVTELPQRFQRQLISEEEIEYINRGGPE